MGIPSLFRYITTKYPSTLIYPLKNSLNYFYFDYTTDVLHVDFNAIIHISTHPEDGKNPETEEEMFENISKNLIKLIKAVNPKKMVYISTDGVVPRAKMNHQRGRRIVSAYGSKDAIVNLTNNTEDEIKDNSNKKNWDINSITPGTKFMNRLARYIIKSIQYFVSTTTLNIKFIYSTDLTPGEGEHKILDLIKSLPKDLNHTIYSPDGDFIFLGLTLHAFNVKIVREDLNFLMKFKNEECKKCYKTGHLTADCGILRLKRLITININKLSSVICSELEMKIVKKFDNSRILDDLIFISFLAGNDFLPSLPCIDVRFFGIDYLINLLSSTFNGSYITDSDKINKEEFLNFLKIVGEEEDAIYQNKKKSLVESRVKFKLQEEFESIELDTKEGRDTYYSKKLECKNEDDIYKACISYMIGCEWVYRYYIGKQKNWRLFYPYHYSPFAKDMAKIPLKDIRFDGKVTEKITPIEQLIMVLPVQSKDLLPKTLHSFYDDYKFDVKIDMFDKLFDWQAIVDIPFLDSNSCIAFFNKNKETIPPDFLYWNTTINDLVFIGKKDSQYSKACDVYKRVNNSGVVDLWNVKGSNIGLELEKVSRLDRRITFKNTCCCLEIIK